MHDVFALGAVASFNANELSPFRQGQRLGAHRMLPYGRVDIIVAKLPPCCGIVEQPESGPRPSALYKQPEEHVASCLSDSDPWLLPACAY